MYHSKITKEVSNQVHEILVDAVVKDAGTYFFRSDTGTSKTQGFIKAVASIVENSNKRFAIAVPTSEDAEAVYTGLHGLIGNKVAVWTKKHQDGLFGFPKYKAKTKSQVFVGTHKYLLDVKSDAKKFVGDRDCLIVDEVPNEMEMGVLKTTDFTAAVNVAVSLGLCSVGLLRKMDQKARKALEELENNPQNNFSSFQNVSIENLSKYHDELHETTNDIVLKDTVQKVFDLLEASHQGRAFSRTQKVPRKNKQGAELLHCFISDLNENFPTKVIFSATLDLDGFQFSPSYVENVREGATVNYSNLSVQLVDWKQQKKHVKDIVSVSERREFAKKHLTDIIQRTEIGSQVLVVVPKLILSDMEIAISGIEDRIIHITNYGRDVGSNKYKDCTEVILWHMLYKPTHTTVGEYLNYSEKLSSYLDNINFNNGITGKFRQLGTDQQYAVIKQMGSRGCVRFVKDDGTTHPMRLWISWKDLDAKRLKRVFPNCVIRSDLVEKPQGNKRVRKDIVQRVSEYLLSLDDNLQEADWSHLKSTIPIIVNRTKILAERALEFELLGWAFVPAVSGRNGSPPRFIRVNTVL